MSGAGPTRPSRRSRLRLIWGAIRWPLIAAIALLAFVLGCFGFGQVLDARGGSSFWDRVYLSLQLFAMESGSVPPPVPLSLEIARILAPAAAFYAALAAILAIFREQVARVRVRWFARDHVVVCGLGRTGRALARGFLERGHRVVAIEIDPRGGAIPEVREMGGSVLVGDARERTVLAEARVDRARYLFAVSSRDGDNAAIAADARALVAARRGPPLVAFIRVLDVDLAEVLATEMAATAGDRFVLELFNPAERGARALLGEHPPFDERGSTPLGPPHLLVVGLGEVGTRLVLQAARRWGATDGLGGLRLRVTAVDREARTHVEALALRYPRLERVCELVPFDAEVHGPDFERGAFLLDPGAPRPTSAYVCLGEDATGLAAGVRLRRVLRDPRVPIVVRTQEHGGLGALFGRDAAGYENFHVFGLLDVTCRPDEVLMGRQEILARAAHEEYVRRQREEGHTPYENPSMVAWDRLPEHLRESNRSQVADIGNKLRAIGCDIEPLSDFESDRFRFEPEELELLARREHERWWRERRASGWTYGPEKDVERKRSPYLVPWEEIPEEIREYDRNAVRGIPAFLTRAGFRVVRVREEARADGV